MRIEPRQQIIDVWRSIARTSFRQGAWRWGGREGSNSISDAEHLLCLMSPATAVGIFKLDLPDQTADDVLTALRPLGDEVGIPRMLTRILTDYLRRYSDPDGTPVFAGEGYFAAHDSDAKPTDEQLRLDVVDSFAMSVTLSLAIIGFARVFRRSVRSDGLRRDLYELEEMASRRLTAAMIGLLRSFTVYVFDADSSEGRELIRTANQRHLPERQVAEELREALRTVRASLRDVTIGSGSGQAEELDNPSRLFECGWSWGITDNAPRIPTQSDVGVQPPGVAEAKPYLYFTVVALDGIAELFSERTQLLGLLDEEQQRLARSLQLRWTLTQSYWSTISTFGQGRWPLEDIPWRTTDSVESDYFSLLVTSIVVQALVSRRATDTDLNRVSGVLEELASRSRITRRPFQEEDRNTRLHVPGLGVTLGGSETVGPLLSWRIADFSPVLLKRTLSIADLLRDPELRGRTVELADEVWAHLLQRRLSADSRLNLWDEPANLFSTVGERHEQPSWYYTKRVVDCLVTAARVITTPPLRSERVESFATDLLSEAGHLFDQELLNTPSAAGPVIQTKLHQIRALLDRAEVLRRSRPGTSVALAVGVLRELDQLAAARQDDSGTL